MAKGYRKKKAKLQNWTCENIWLSKMFRLASSSIKWEGLPEEIDTVLMENLINRGSSAIIGFDDILGEWIVAQNASFGRIDHNGYPIIRRGVCVNGLNVNFENSGSVIIFNNSMRTNDFWIWNYCAEYMANLDMAIRINCNSQKTMPIIPASQPQQLTLENLYDNLESNMPYTLVDGNSMDVEKLQMALQFDNKKSFTADGLMMVQNEIWCRILTMLGINNINHFKKSGVNVQETDANLDEIVYFRRDRLNAREVAARKMKEVFGWDVKVSYYSEGVNQRGLLYGGSQDNIAEPVSK